MFYSPIVASGFCGPQKETQTGAWGSDPITVLHEANVRGELSSHLVKRRREDNPRAQGHKEWVVSRTQDVYHLKTQTPPKKNHHQVEFPGGTGVKDPVLPLLRLGLQLWCGFDPRPGNFCMPRMRPKNPQTTSIRTIRTSRGLLPAHPTGPGASAEGAGVGKALTASGVRRPGGWHWDCSLLAISPPHPHSKGSVCAGHEQGKNSLLPNSCPAQRWSLETRFNPSTCCPSG